MTTTDPELARVTVTIDEEVRAVGAALAGFPWTHRKAYAMWLAQTYYYVRHVSRILALSAARTPIDQDAMHDHFLHGIAEEKGHIDMPLRDIEELGMSIADLPEHPLTTAFYQTLYHQIDFYGPTATLGYFFVLEGAAAEQGRGVLGTLRQCYGGKGIVFVEEHAIADIDHYPQSRSLPATLPKHQLPILDASTRLASRLYCSMVVAIAQEAR